MQHPKYSYRQGSSLQTLFCKFKNIGFVLSQIYQYRDKLVSFLSIANDSTSKDSILRAMTFISIRNQGRYMLFSCQCPCHTDFPLSCDTLPHSIVCTPSCTQLVNMAFNCPRIWLATPYSATWMPTLQVRLSCRVIPYNTTEDSCFHIWHTQAPPIVCYRTHA